MTEHPQPTPTHSQDVRISTLVGDRLCIRCGYNLVGQPILRERHYDMLIVRCPECATVASVQEYPLLGRWANRWAAMLAAAWLLAIIALWLASAGVIFGFSYGSGEAGADSYASMLATKFADWCNEQANPNTQGPTIAISPAGRPTIIRPGSNDFRTWWLLQDHAALLHEWGGYRAAFNPLVWYLWMWLMIVSVVLGVMWATILPGRRRGGLLLVGVLLIFTAAAIGLIPLIEYFSSEPSWTYQAAAQKVVPIVMGIALLWAWAWLSIGLIFGRALARGFVTLMLPPRMRSALSYLWLCDGRNPPRPI